MATTTITTKTNEVTGRTVASCNRCEWTYANPVKAAVEEEKRWHREHHRRQDAKAATS